MRGRGWGAAGVALLLAGAPGGCELDEVALTAPEVVVVAEVFLQVGNGADQVTAFLHRTLGGGRRTALEEARVVIRGEGGLVVTPPLGELSACVDTGEAGGVEGACFTEALRGRVRFMPGERVEVEITLPGGGRLRGATTVPGEFALLQPSGVSECFLPPGETLELRWTRARGAWSYLAEAGIHGLREALAPRGIVVAKDSLVLLGLAAGEADTTLVFPAEFGVFDRFDLEREVAVALQGGLPPGTDATVALAAVDRNYVNWVRGGSFNPSGQVRIPSIRGDGTGVVASMVRKTFRVLTEREPSPGGVPLPPCRAQG